MPANSEKQLFLNLFRYSLFLSALLFVGGYPSLGQSNPHWSWYASDDFDGTVLRPRWALENLESRVEGGNLLLFSEAPEERGNMFLRSVWTPDTCIPVSGSWSFHADLVIENNDDFSNSGGIFSRLVDTQGGEFELSVGLSKGKLKYSFGESEETIDFDLALLSLPAVVQLRIESVGPDGQMYRAGVSGADSNESHWSPVTEIDFVPTHTCGIGLYCEGIQGTVFDRVLFEGDCFDFPPSGPIEYVRPNASKLDISMPGGKTYEATVPDTIDFAERARLALSAITKITDPSADYEPYSHIYFNPEGWLGPNGAYNPDMERKPPVFIHDYHGYNTGIGEGQLESIPLLQLASGNTESCNVAETMFHTARKMIGEDGQTYVPLRGRPWSLFLTFGMRNQLNGPWWESGQYPAGEPLRCRMLATLCAWHAVHPDPVLEQEIRLMVDNMVRKHDVAATSTRGLVQAYRTIGYQPALDLALDYVDAALNVFDEDGSWSGHFHLHTQTLLALLEIAVATDDDALLERVRRAYEFARTKGWPIVGHYPEGTDSPPYPCETCEVAEMIQLGILLSRLGVGDYWDDVDRAARNQFAEQQLIDTSWIAEFASAIPDYNTPTPGNYPGVTDTISRQIGSFSSYGSINEWSLFLPHSPGGAVGCCTGNGALAVYYIWKNILTCDGAQLRVNLLMNRASKWADIDSHIPYEGRVEIRMKQTLPLWVRIPEWIDKEDFTCRIGDRRLGLKWEGPFASPGILEEGEKVIFAFPIGIRQVKTRIGMVDCNLTIKGNTVVRVDPPGKICPIYQRSHYLQPVAPKKRMTRFAPDKEVDVGFSYRTTVKD